MNEDRIREDAQADLRQRAEKAIGRTEIEPAALSLEEAQRLVHELQVSQIELELQNEELRDTQHQLATSRDQYLNLYQALPVGYFVLDEIGLVLHANRTGCDLMGMTAFRLRGTAFGDRLLRADRDTFHSLCKRVRETRALDTCELRVVGEAGETWDAQIDCFLSQDIEGSDQLRLIVTDITEVKQAEARNAELQKCAVEQQKLAVVGQLAAGIAHDFNNILTGIIGQAQLMSLSPQLSEPFREDLKIIQEQGQRAAQLIRQILDFSRKSILWKRPLDLGPFVEETASLLRRTIPESINIRLDIAPGPHTVNADSAQLQRVLLNLAVNAKDAMLDGGELNIQLRDLVVGPDDTALLGMAAGKWFTLSVADTGTGIDPDVLPHIYEPFFTTKEVGKGTGLGLSQAYGIIQQHGGDIGVTSERGLGTTFVISLPAIDVSTSLAFAAQLSSDRRGQNEVILLAEDDRIVLETVQRMLESLGYSVLAAPDGREAWKLYQKHRSSIALVLVDIVMPKIGGLKLHQMLKDELRGPKVVLMSGYPLTQHPDSLAVQDVAGWLQKPLLIEPLAQTIRTALDS